MKRDRDLADGMMQFAIAPRHGIFDKRGMMGRLFGGLLHDFMDSARNARENLGDIDRLRRFRQHDLPEMPAPLGGA